MYLVLSGLTFWVLMNILKDNSRRPVDVVSSKPSGYDGFTLGQNAVLFTATDEAGNENYCIFSVVVLGMSIYSMS